MRTLISDRTAALRTQAQRLGFDACRIAAPASTPQAQRALAEWLDAGAHGDMEWMRTTQTRRADPLKLWPQARSIVMLGINYAPAGDPLGALANKSAGSISVYARHRDYHDVVKGRLKSLASWLARAWEGAEVKVFVDTAPVMEKPLAQASGLGWQGKHTNLVSRRYGSWLLLGSIFTTADLAPDAAEADRCG